MRRPFEFLGLRGTSFGGLTFAALPVGIGLGVGFGHGEVALATQAIGYGVIFLATAVQGIDRRGFLLFLATIAVLVVPVTIHVAIFGDPFWVEGAHFLAAAIVAWVGRKHFRRAPWALAFYVMVILTTVIFLVYPNRIGEEFAHRTYWTYPLMAIWLALALRDAVRDGTVAAGPLMAMIWVGILTSSRSITLASAGALALAAAERLWRRKKSEVWLPILMMVAAVILVALPNQEWLVEAPAVERISEMGVDSPRYFLWAEYLLNLEERTFLFGGELDARQQLAAAVIGSEENTLHNVFLQLHSVGGIIPVIAAVLGLMVVASALVNLTGRIIHPVLLLVGAKGAFDVIALPQRFDVIYLLVFFVAWEVWIHRRSAETGEAMRFAGRARPGALKVAEPT